jgi:hypothetical protein
VDDLTICKRIAEIEGIKLTIKCCYVNGFFNRHALMTSEHEEYNPLTDDALCFQLMLKYCVDLQCYENDSGKLMYWIANEYFLGDYENPNKAICLAIIEIYK